MAVFLVYLVSVFCLLKFKLNFDLVFGCIQCLRKKKNPSLGSSITTQLTLLLVVVSLIPVAIGMAWGIHISLSVFVDWSMGLSIFLAVVFTSSALLGFVTWYSNNWTMERTSQIFFTIAAISCAVFAILVTIVPANYTFTGTTSIFLCLNFVPACYLLYAKASWDDIDLKLLYTELSK